MNLVIIRYVDVQVSRVLLSEEEDTVVVEEPEADDEDLRTCSFAKPFCESGPFPLMFVTSCNSKSLSLFSSVKSLAVAETEELVNTVRLWINFERTGSEIWEVEVEVMLGLLVMFGVMPPP